MRQPLDLARLRTQNFAPGSMKNPEKRMNEYHVANLVATADVADAAQAATFEYIGEYSSGMDLSKHPDYKPVHFDYDAGSGLEQHLGIVINGQMYDMGTLNPI